MLTAPIQIAASGVIVPGVPGKKVRVYAWSLSANTLGDDGQLKWQSQSPASPPVLTDLTGYRYVVAGVGPWDVPMATTRPAGRVDAYFESLVGEGLALNLQSPFDVGGFVCYEIVVQ
jgi:hypothetical protein